MFTTIALVLSLALGQNGSAPPSRLNQQLQIELGTPQESAVAQGKELPKKAEEPKSVVPDKGKEPAKGKEPDKSKEPKKGDQPKVDKQKVEELPAPAESDPIAKALPAPELEAGEEGLVISLAAALRLTNTEAWDIRIAIQQFQIAVAQRQQADVLWLPTMIGGVDYTYHSGPIQNIDGTMANNSRSAMYAGGAPLAIFALTDAIFSPLSTRQVVRAQDANIQTARNDTLTDIATVYFSLLEAEADLASILDVDRRAIQLVEKTEQISPGLVGTVELARTRTLRANIAQLAETARQRWRTASAEVARLARLRPSVVLQPLEPPHVRVTLVSETMNPEQLITIAITNRPELTFYEAQARAAQERARQEKWRPFLPTLIGRGGGTTPPYPMAFGAYGGGSGSDLSGFQQRSDWDVSAVWTLQNLGLGNLALIRERNREYDLSRSQQYRFRDVVAREVMVALADVRSAARRVSLSEQELREALISAKQNLEGLGQTKRPGAGAQPGGINILVIRPQEVVQALQALSAAYFNFYGVVAEYNRAQFRLYRALGNPAQMLAGHNALGGPLLDNHDAVHNNDPNVEQARHTAMRVPSQSP